jgi:hypothetical protein
MSHARITLLFASAFAFAVTAAPLHAQQSEAQPGADATPLLEADAATKTAQAAEDAKPSRQASKKERRICKSTAPTGTRIAKKTCLTQAQWEEAERRSQDATDTAQKNQLLINKQGN